MRPRLSLLGLVCLALFPAVAQATQSSTPTLRVTKADALRVDADGSGDVSAGDTLRYTAVVSNPGPVAVSSAVYHDAADPATALVAGSVTTTRGTVAMGNAAADTTVTVDLGALAAGASATVSFDVLVGSSAGPLVANQGYAAGQGVPGVPTDDPDTPQSGDATLTVLGQRPQLDAVQAVTLDVDLDRSHGVSTADVLKYTVKLRNAGTAAATGVVFTERPRNGTVLIPRTLTTSAGTVTSGNRLFETTATVNVGSIAPGGMVTITFKVFVLALPGTAFVFNQGSATSTGAAAEPTDDPDTLADDDPTRTALQRGGAVLSAAKLDTLLVDADGDGQSGAGDVLRYLVIVTNTGTADATGVVFTDSPDPNTVLATGTVVVSAGTVTSGNSAGQTSVRVSVGTLRAGQSAVFAFAAAIRNPLPAAVSQVANQGSVASTGRPALPTDDPSTPAAGDATVTPVTAAAVRASLGDFVWDDTDADGIQDAGEPGISGVTVRLLSAGGGLLQTTSSGAAGLYRFSNLSPGDYVVEFVAPAGFAFSPRDQGSDDALDSDADPATGRTGTITLGSADNFTVDAGLVRSAGLGDFVWEDLDGDGVQDAGEPGIGGVAVRLLDGAGNSLASTTTAADGLYQLSNLATGSYAVEFAAPAGFVFTAKDQGVDDAVDSDADPATGRTAPIAVSAGGAINTVDAGLYRRVGVSGFVWDDADGDGVQAPTERGIAAALVELLDGGGQSLAIGTTDAGGFYRFEERAPGAYAVHFVRPSGFAFSPQDQGTDDTKDSDVDPATGRTAAFTLRSGDSRGAEDAGLGQPITTVTSSPAGGETDVALERETILHLSSALAPSAVVDDAKLFAEFGGHRLTTRIHLSPDRRTLTLFYVDPLPASARVRVTLVGDGLANEFGNDVDADGNSVAGGTAVIDFDTLNLTTIPGTRVCGRVFASELAPGDSGSSVNVPLEGVTIRVEGSATLRALTDPQGNFCLDPAPVGKFFVLVDGRTAVNGVPPGTYYPAVGKAWESIAGQEVNVGNAFLPLVPPGTLQPVSQTAETEITFVPSIMAQFPELEGTRIMVPADSLFANDGTRGGMVGIAPVPPDRLPGQLPPGLEFPLVITVQTNGPTNFDKPVPVCLPNLPDPVSGQRLSPGDKNGLFSFNHDTGAWEFEGPMTVTADGRLICTDPGVGITAPGWHGSGPPPSGPPPPPPPPPCPPGQTKNCTPPPPPPPCPRPPDPDLGFKLALCAQERDNGFNTCTRTAQAFTLAATLAYGATMAACVVACGATVIGCTGLIPCYLAASASYTAALTFISVQLNNCVQDKVEAYELCVKRAMGPPPPPCPTPIVAAVESSPSTIPPAELPFPLLAADPVIDQVTQLLNQAKDLLEPYARSGQQPPDSVLMQAFDLRNQADAVAGGSANNVLRTGLLLQEPTLQALDDPTSPARGNAPPYPILYKAEIVRPGGVHLQLRGQTLPNGQYSLFVPRDGSLFSISFYDPRTKSFGIVFPRATANLRYQIPRATLSPVDSNAIDGDQDGLADVVEAVYGTDPALADTDQDGVFDGAEVDQGTNPLDGQPAQTGIIASADTPGTAVDVCAINNVAVVADSAAGVSVFNAFNGMEPRIIAQVDTPGNAGAVSCTGNLIAVADGTAGLAVIDVSDPPAARIVHQVDVGGVAQAVAVAGNVAYVGLNNGQLVAVDLPSGTVLQRLTVGGAVQDVAIGGDTLYVLTVGTLHAIPLLAGDLSIASSVTSPGGPGAGQRRLRLFAGGDVLYATHTAGYNTFSLALPDQPVLIAAGNTAQRGWKQIVTNGSGLGVAAVSPNSTNDGAHDVYLYDVSDPAQTNAFLTLFPTPGLAAAVSIYNGLAFAADSEAGLQVINYLSYDTRGIAPSLTLTTNFASGVAEEGQLIRLTATVADDVQVRNVEFFVDGAKVLTDGNFPFEHRFVTPLLSQQTSFTIRACATDTGGNRTCTAEQTVTLTEDATAPRVTTVTPRNGASVGEGSVSASSAVFSEPIDSSTLSLRLFAAGPDGIAGNGDDVEVSGGEVTYREDIRTAFLTFNTPLPADLYRGVVGATVADLHGNAIGADFVWTFRVRGPLSWINPAGGLWSNPANWSDGVVPGPSDIAYVTLTGNYTVLVDRSFTVGSLTLGSLLGAPPTLWIQGNGASNTTLTVTDDFNSSGIVRLESQGAGTVSQLTVGGLFTNTGTINVEPGSGGPRTLAGNLNNLGTLNVDVNLTLSKASGVYSNEGTVNVAAGQRLIIPDQGQTFNQNNGRVMGTGFVDLSGNSTFNFNGGDVEGAAPIVSDATLRFGAAATGAGSFVLRGSSPKLAGNIAAGQSVWIRGDGGANTTATAANGFTNAGTLRLESQGAGTTSNLTVSNGALINTGAIDVNLGSGGPRDFNLNLDNRGTVSVNTNSNWNKPGGLHVNQGTVTIATGQRLLINGQNQVFQQNAGSLVVTGTLEFVSTSTLAFNGGNATGSPALISDATLSLGAGSTGTGTFVLRGTSPKLAGDIAAGQTVWVRGDGAANTTATAATGFTNAGTLRLESQGAGTTSNLTVTAGTLINTGTLEVNVGSGGPRDFNANLDNRGLFKVNQNSNVNRASGVHHNSGQIQIAAGPRLLINGQSQVFNQDGGSLDVNGTFELNSTTTLVVNGGAATGSPVLLSEATLSLGAGSTGTGTFVLRGTSPKLAGDVAAGQTVWVRGDGAANTTATAATGFTNAGTLRLESQGAGTTSNLTVTTGTLINTGTLEVNAGSGGPRDINASVDNRGLFKVSQNCNLNKSSGDHHNSGQLQIAAGPRLLVNGQTQVFNQEGGTLEVTGTFELNSSTTLVLAGGAATGSPVLLSDATLSVAPSSTATGTFVLRGTSPKLNGDVAAGQTVWIRGDGAANTTAVAASGFTNNGTLRLESQGAGTTSNLTVTGGGTLVNAGSVDVNAGSGGPRTIAASVNNLGTFTVNTSSTVSGATFDNAAGGILRGTGNLTLSTATLNNAGAVNPGTSPGIFTTNRFAQAAAGEVNVELGGTTVGTDFDQLNVTGAATLTGTLNVSLINGFTPALGQTFRVVAWSTRTGTFATLNGLDLGGGLRLDPTYGATGLTLTVVTAP